MKSSVARKLSNVRNWLLIGPLVERLHWLRNATATGDAAASKAAPGNAAAAAAAAVESIGTPPPVLPIVVRSLETVWIVCKHDRVLVIMSIHLDDEVDVALGRAFCQEFAETDRKSTDVSVPCSFNGPKEGPPSDLKSVTIPNKPNVGFLSLTLSDQHVRNATDDRLIVLARPVMTFRNFFNFHLKHAKSFLHSRLRKNLATWEQNVQSSRREKGPGKKRMASGKVFAPEPRTAPA